MSSARPTFEEALTQLNVELIKMGATVEKSIMDAVEAFKNPSVNRVAMNT